MGVVRNMVTKKAKEKISSKASFLSPLEKMAESFHLKEKINEELDEKEVKSEAFGEQKELGAEVESAPEKNFKESFVKRIIKTSLGILGFGVGREILSKKATENVAGKTADILTDEKKLKKANDKLEKELNNKNSLIHRLHHEKDPEKKKKIKLKIDKYRDENFGFWDMMKDTWVETSVNEKGEKRGLFSHLWYSAGKFFSTNIVFYFGVKKAEKAGLFKLREEAEALQKKGKKFEKSVKKELKNSKQALRAEKESGVRFLRNRIPAKDLVKGFEKEVKALNKSFKSGKISAKTLAKGIEEANIKLFKDATFNRQVKPLIKIMKKGGIKGMELPANFSLKKANPLKNITKLKINPVAMAVSVAITKAVLDGKDEASFREVGRSLFSRETLTEAFVPGVGSWRSVKRNWDNSEVPTWLKATDIGLNVVGDVMLAAGYFSSIFSFGAGAAAGVAGRTAVVGFGKRWLTREGLKIAAKEVGKTVVTKEGRKIALNSAKKSVIQGAKASAISTPIILGAQIAMKKFFNKEKVNEAFNEMLSDEQQRTIRLTKQLKQTESKYQVAA